MNDLQLGLLAAGAVVIALVILYNWVQERRARRRAEKAFGHEAGDALFDTPPAARKPAAAEERREPVLGRLPGTERSEPVLARTQAQPMPAGEALALSGGPQAEISSRIDTVAVILADDPVTSEQVEPLEDALQAHTTPVHIEGIVDEQWHPIATSPKRSWRELRAGLQLASRKGPLGEEEIAAFNEAIAQFAGRVNAVSQREAPATAATRARELDAFCADADIEVAVNLVGEMGATFAVAKMKQLALEQGFAETADGELVAYGADGAPDFVIRRFDAPGSKPTPTYFTGLTFALDVPHVADAPAAFDAMVARAGQLAQRLGARLVDDNRRALTDAGIAAIRRSVEKVARDMEAHGVPAGSPLARRLFS